MTWTPSSPGCPNLAKLRIFRVPSRPFDPLLDLNTSSAPPRGSSEAAKSPPHRTDATLQLFFLIRAPRLACCSFKEPAAPHGCDIAVILSHPCAAAALLKFQYGGICGLPRCFRPPAPTRPCWRHAPAGPQLYHAAAPRRRGQPAESRPRRQPPKRTSKGPLPRQTGGTPSCRRTRNGPPREKNNFLARPASPSYQAYPCPPLQSISDCQTPPSRIIRCSARVP